MGLGGKEGVKWPRSPMVGVVWCVLGGVTCGGGVWCSVCGSRLLSILWERRIVADGFCCRNGVQCMDRVVGIAGEDVKSGGVGRVSGWSEGIEATVCRKYRVSRGADGKWYAHRGDELYVSAPRLEQVMEHIRDFGYV
jgi:hypothetical protein